MLAYSSVSQMGYILLGVGLSPLSPWGLVGAAAHILNHAIGKGCLFMCAGAISQQEGLRDIRDFEGLGKKMPHVCAAFTIAALSMIGIPLTAGFTSKLFLIVASLDAAQYPFVAVLLLSGLLNLVYFWRVIDQMYFVKHKETENAPEITGERKSLPHQHACAYTDPRISLHHHGRRLAHRYSFAFDQSHIIEFENGGDALMELMTPLFAILCPAIAAALILPSRNHPNIREDGQ